MALGDECTRQRQKRSKVAVPGLGGQQHAHSPSVGTSTRLAIVDFVRGHRLDREPNGSSHFDASNS